MSRFWEIVFCVPLLFLRHVCLSNLKHAPSRKLSLTARKTVLSHLKTLDDVGLDCSNINTVIKLFKNASVILIIKCTLQYFLKNV